MAPDDSGSRIESFPEFAAEKSLLHGFTLRAPGVKSDVGREEAVENLLPFFREELEALGGDFERLQTAEQIHGAGIAIAGNGVQNLLPNLHLGVDALITNTPGLTLGILVADCCAVYVYDAVHQAVGLAHSGKKGTELGIVPAMLERMTQAFGTAAQDVTVRLSPCIRPPHYEIDFAAEIRQQCLDAGVKTGHLRDDLRCTAAEAGRYYSYRLEKGMTGRMMALLGIRASE